MKFHLKMTLCMLAVLAALFGAGGSLLISESFEDSLEREKTAALGDYRMAWGTLQIVNSMDTYLDRDAIVKTMEQLYQQNSASWSALRLSTGDEVLYENCLFPDKFLLDFLRNPVTFCRFFLRGQLNDITWPHRYFLHRFPCPRK